jgi:hypothetical protein
MLARAVINAGVCCAGISIVAVIVAITGCSAFAFYTAINVRVFYTTTGSVAVTIMVSGPYLIAFTNITAITIHYADKASAIKVFAITLWAVNVISSAGQFTLLS